MYQTYVNTSLYVRSLKILIGGMFVLGVFVTALHTASAQVSISGTLYESNGTTTITTGETVTVAIGTSTPSLHSATSNGSGVYTVSGIATSTGGTSWTDRTVPTGSLTSVVYAQGLFVGVSCGTAGGCNATVANRVVTSPDGITWTSRSAAGNDDQWRSVTYGNGLFVAVGQSGDRVMTSPDGITWTARSAAGDNDPWQAITYGDGLFVAVAQTGDRVMTSPDGITWTVTVGNVFGAPSGRGITYQNGLFVMVGTGVHTSPDGITWTARTAAGDNDVWNSVTSANGLFVAVSSSGDRVMTSPDSITWTARTAAGDNDAWRSVTYINGLFVAVSCGSGTTCNSTAADRVMTSPDGITWTVQSASGNNDQWHGVVYPCHVVTAWSFGLYSHHGVYQ
jgi:hypothetical protein